MQFLNYMISLDQDFVTAMIDHIGMLGMDELLLKLMCCDSLESSDEGPLAMSTPQNNPYRIKLFEALHTYSQQQRQNAENGSNTVNIHPNDIDLAAVTNWWISHNVVELLIGKLDSDFDNEIHSSVCYTLTEALRRSANARTIVHVDHPISTLLHSTEVIEKLVDKILINVCMECLQLLLLF